MEEIKVGEYVRTKKGYIAKFIRFNNTLGVLEFDKTIWEKSYVPKQTISFSDFKKRVKKHSSDIIDLVEVGDYVNGYKVINIDTGYIYVDRTKLGTNLLTTFTDYQIKSIVTKKQFESIEYKLED